MVLLGIALGLLAATSQSVSYLFSRLYCLGPGASLRRLLVISHVIQGAVSLPLVVLAWPADVGPVRLWIVPVLATAGFYLVGQTCLLIALRYTTASRVAPLLGLKVVTVALLTVVVLGDHVSVGQWLAVGLAVMGAFVLNHTGGSLPPPALAAIAGACLGYTGSDFHIRVTLEAMPDVPPVHASFFAMAATYLICGLAAMPLLPWYGSRQFRQWTAATPYALSWLTAMGFLFACFALAGLVLGNIVQSLRGLISIALAGMLASYGLVHLEAKLTRRVYWRRFAAAVLMTAAVALFVLAGTEG